MEENTAEVIASSETALETSGEVAVSATAATAEQSDALSVTLVAVSESVSMADATKTQGMDSEAVRDARSAVEMVKGTGSPPPTKRSKTGITADEIDAKSQDIEEKSDAGKEEMKMANPSEMLPGEPRKFQRIPIFIADYHNDVLEFIYRCLATRHLPLEGNILVHFDSHPDMVISREIPASASYDKETMLAELSIENWIMPACYAGHFNRVIWLKNSWCKQIPLGKYKFKIGSKDDKISVDCPLDYFISEGNYCDTEELQLARDMELQVYNVDTTNEDSDIDTKEFLTSADAPNFVLDIDLDFFSTSNPFLEIYKDANCYEQLTDIFHFDPLAAKDTGGTTECRKLQLEALKKIFEHLEEARTLEGLTPPPDPAVISTEIYKRIENLAQTLQKHYADDEIDWLLIYDSGSTTDTNGLPHHISTTNELEQYFKQFQQLLQQLPVPPVLITIACSAEDDYCPKHQVSAIQERVLSVLREVYGDKLQDKPILHYLDEEWDVMQL